MLWKPMSIAMKLVTTRISSTELSHEPTSASAIANTKPAGSFAATLPTLSVPTEMLSAHVVNA